MQTTYSYKHFFNRKLFIILILGFSSGLPLALTSSTLQAWYTVSGVNILAIGLLGLVGQPYIYKFIWAPLMDRYAIPGLGRRRGWMLITQTFLLISIMTMAFFQPEKTPVLLGCLGFFVAFLSASQDITIDAYRTDILLPDERGIGSSMAIAGYRIAMMVSGGGALILAQEIGWHSTYIIMSLLMVVGMMATLVATEPNHQSHAPGTLLTAIINPFRELILKPSGLTILLFIVLYKLSYEFQLVMTPTFLLRDLGFTLAQVGTINKGIGFIALFVGIFIGGISLIRLGIIRALLIFGSLQALGTLNYAILAVIGKSVPALIAVISADNFFVGMEAAAFVAFLTGLCNQRYTAMQFALLSALATIGRIFAGPIGAVFINYHGWFAFYIMSFLVAIPALLLLWHQRNKFTSTITEQAYCQNNALTVEFEQPPSK